MLGETTGRDEMSRLLINDNTPRYVEVVDKDMEVQAIFYARTIKEAKAKAQVYLRAQKISAWTVRRILVKLIFITRKWAFSWSRHGRIFKFIHIVTNEMVKCLALTDVEVLAMSARGE